MTKSTFSQNKLCENAIIRKTSFVGILGNIALHLNYLLVLQDILVLCFLMPFILFQMSLLLLLLF